MFTYKIDVLQALKQAGYSTYRLRKEKIIGECSIQYIRDGKIVGIDTLDTICTLLHCNIGDIITHEKPTE